MSTLILYDASAPADLVSAARTRYPHALVAVWDRGRVAEGELSVPAFLASRLLPIRDELAAWTYETAHVALPGLCGPRTVEERLRCGDSLSMWWLSTLAEKHPKVTRNLFEALKARALELFMNEHDVRHLVLVTSNRVLARTLSRYCATTGKGFTRVKHEKCQCVAKLGTVLRTGLGTALRTAWADFGTSARRMVTGLRTAGRAVYYHIPAPVQAGGRFVHWLATVRRVLPPTRDKAPAAGFSGTIATYFPNIDLGLAREGRFRSRYFENLHDALNDPANSGPNGQHPVNWLFIYFPSPQCTLEEAKALRNGFAASGVDGASFHFWEEFLSWAGLGRALTRYARLVVASLPMDCAIRRHFTFPGSQMDLWPLLKGNWRDSTRGWRALERCLMAEAFTGYAAWAGLQRWTTFPQENCPWERLLAKALHEAGHGPVYGAQHSTVRPTDFRYFDDPRIFADPTCASAMLDAWLCNGSASYGALTRAGMPAERAAVVEALRYLYLGAGETSAPAVTSRRLVLMTSFFADEVDAHLATLAEAVAGGHLAGWEVAVKAHPYLPVASRLAALFPDGAPLTILDEPVGRLLTPGTVIWASNSTTVALEAAFRHLPVLVQAAENDADLCPLQDLPGVTMIRTGADVGAALATPKAPDIPANYLALDPALPQWKRWLGLN